MRAVILAAGIALAVPAMAQRPGGSIDAGALSMQYADSIDANAIALTPAFWIESRFASLSTTGTLSQFSGGGWSAQATGDGSLFTKTSGLFMGELQGSAGGSSRNDASRTGQVLAMGRGHISNESNGAWIGAGLGSTWDGAEWRSVRQAEAAAWMRRGNATLLLSTTPTSVDDSIRYADTELAAGLNVQRFDFSASGGFRSGSRLPTLGGSAKSWGSVSVTAWLAPRIGLVASGGTYPVDLTQGFPGGRFISLSLRYGVRRFTPASEPVVEMRPTKMFDIRNVDRSLRTIRIKSSSAQKVEVMGDFTDWSPVQLESGADGWWTVTLPIEPGLHEINMRIDGGKWVVPPGLARKSDEFGGSVGIILISM
ncbi:MAG TPA: glycogen-binding domain-containing protein [Gemmatimonadaceae bacterium]